jgi:hypothetical protein
MILPGRRNFSLTKATKTWAQEVMPVTDAQARKTVLLVSFVFLLIAAWNFYKGRMIVVYVLGGVIVALMIIGLCVPPAARVFHGFWMRVASLLGHVNNRIILLVLYYGMFTPFGLISRLVGRDPLNRRSERRDTYWVLRENSRQPKERFERLF